MRLLNIKVASWDIALILPLPSYDNVNAVANQGTNTIFIELYPGMA